MNMTDCTIFLRDLRVLRGENWVAAGRAGTLRETIRIIPPNEITAQVVDAACKIHTQLGLLQNFGLKRMRDGITRIVNGLPKPPNPSEEIE